MIFSLRYKIILIYLSLFFLLFTKSGYAESRNNSKEEQGRGSPKYTLEFDSVRAIYSPLNEVSSFNALEEFKSKDDAILNLEGNVVLNDYVHDLKLFTDSMLLSRGSSNIDIRANSVLIKNTSKKKEKFSLNELYAKYIYYSNYQCKLKILDAYLRVGFDIALYFSDLESSDRETFILKDINFRLCNPDAQTKNTEITSQDSFIKERGKISSRGWNFYATSIEYSKPKERVRLYNVLFRYKKLPIFYLPRYSTYRDLKHGITSNTGPSYRNQQLSLKLEMFYDLNNAKLFSKKDTKEDVISRLTVGGEFFNPFTEAEYDKRVTNYWVKFISDKKDDHKYGFDVHVAPTSRKFDDHKGFQKDIKSSRYSFDFDVKKVINKDYTVYGKMNLVSDRDFRRLYNLEFVNYLPTTFGGSYFGENGYGTISASKYTPVYKVDEDKITSVAPILELHKEFNRRKGDGTSERYSINLSGVNAVRAEGISTRRLTALLKYRYRKNVNDYYSYDFFSSIRGEVYNQTDQANGNILSSKDFVRAFGTIGFKNDLDLISLRTKSNFLINFKPFLNLSYTQEGMNKKDLSVQDIIVSNFFNADSLFSDSRFMGYDYIEDGLKASYGLKIQLSNLASSSEINFLIGQRFRAKIFNSYDNPLFPADDIQRGFSAYIAEFDSSFFDRRLQIDSSLLVDSEGGKILSNTFGIKVVPVKNITLGLKYIHKDKSLLEYALIPSDTQYRIYSLKKTFKGTSKGVKVFITEDLNFLVGEQNHGSEIVSAGIGVFHDDDCLKYNIDIRYVKFSDGDGDTKKMVGVSMGVKLVL